MTASWRCAPEPRGRDSHSMGGHLKGPKFPLRIWKENHLFRRRPSFYLPFASSERIIYPIGNVSTAQQSFSSKDASLKSGICIHARKTNLLSQDGEQHPRRFGYNTLGSTLTEKTKVPSLLYCTKRIFFTSANATHALRGVLQTEKKQSGLFLV